MKSVDPLYLIATAAAFVAALTPFYVELSVGVIDPPGGAFVTLELGVVAVALLGAVLARFEPEGMARAMTGASVAQALVGVIALLIEPPHPASPPLEVVGVTAFFVALYMGAAWLFRRAGRNGASADAPDA